MTNCINPVHLLFFFIVLAFAYLLFGKKESFSSVNLTSHYNPSQLNEKIIQLQNQLHNCQKQNDTCGRNLAAARAECSVKQSNPDINFPSRNYNDNARFQMIGFLTNDTSRFPLFGRTKYPRRSDKWEYFIVDESRNRIRIPFKTKNDNELFDGENVSIPELGGGSFNVTLYEYSNVRYNPDLM